MPVTAQQLAKLAREADREKYEEAVRHRDRAIVQALKEGKTHAWIAEATGLSRGRIGQLAQTLENNS